jgi:hypothetical protein
MVGRPKRKWIEEVKRKLKGMGIKDWKGTNGRKLWRSPKPKLGCRERYNCVCKFFEVHFLL